MPMQTRIKKSKRLDSVHFHLKEQMQLSSLRREEKDWRRVQLQLLVRAAFLSVLFFIITTDHGY